MKLPIDNKKKGMYLVASIITACFLYMIVSTAWVMGDINGQTSRDLAIDRQIDECHASQEKSFFSF